MPRSTTGKMENIWNNWSIHVILNFKLLSVTAFASYRSESWSLTKREKHQIDAFVMWAYRRVRRLPLAARCTNKWVLNIITARYALRAKMALRKLQYFGHIMRQEDFVSSFCWASDTRANRPCIGLMILMMDRNG